MRRVLPGIAVVALISSAAGSQARLGTVEDEAAIRDRRQAAFAALNRRDSNAIAQFFTADIDRVRGTGAYHAGREDVEKSFATSYVFNDGTVSTNATLREESSRIRFLTADVALLDIVVVQSDGSRTQKERGTIVYVKRDGVWLTAAIRNTPVR